MKKEINKLNRVIEKHDIFVVTMIMLIILLITLKVPLVVSDELEDIFEQESIKVREFIKETFEKIGEIGDYSIYQSN